MTKKSRIHVDLPPQQRSADVERAHLGEHRSRRPLQRNVFEQFGRGERPAAEEKAREQRGGENPMVHV
jgi:hypothetical protein